MHTSNGSRAIVLTDRGWWFLAFTLFVSLPLVSVLVFINPVYDWYLEHLVAPELERRLGFTGGDMLVKRGGVTYRWYGIKTVTPAGVFDRAGIKPGDIPIGYVHGVRSGFIGQLQRSRGRVVTLRFEMSYAVLSGRASEKTVTFTVPPKPAG